MNAPDMPPPGGTVPHAAATGADTFHALTDNIPVGTYVTELLPDGSRRFVFISNRLLQMLDLTRDEVFADWSRAFSRVHPEDMPSLIPVSEASWNDRAHFCWEGRIVVRGDTRWVSVEAAPRPVPGGITVWEGVVIDVTLRKRFERQLEEATQRELDQAIRQQRDLEAKLKTSLTAAAVAHEIMQPLGTILIDSRMALQECDQSGVVTAGTRRRIADVAAEAERVVDMVERMRALLRNVQTAHEPVDLASVVDSAVVFMRPTAMEHDVRLEWGGADGPLTIAGDAAQLKVAIVNAIRNAIEAIVDVQAPTRVVRVELHSLGQLVQCRISDSGPGMPADAPGSMPLTSTKPGGTGLGLFIISTAAENHGGTVEFRRSPLGGAELRLTFPGL